MIFDIFQNLLIKSIKVFDYFYLTILKEEKQSDKIIKDSHFLQIDNELSI